MDSHKIFMFATFSVLLSMKVAYCEMCTLLVDKMRIQTRYLLRTCGLGYVNDPIGFMRVTVTKYVFFFFFQTKNVK